MKEGVQTNHFQGAHKVFRLVRLPSSGGIVPVSCVLTMVLQEKGGYKAAAPWNSLCRK